MIQLRDASGRSSLAGSPLGSPADAASTARSVREMFGAVAPRYDFLNHALSCGFDLWWRRVTAGALSAVLGNSGSVAVDVCCGTGDLTFALARISRGMVIGADFCRPMLQRASLKLRRKARRGLRRQVAFMGADTLSLPLNDASVDVVTSGFGFRNLADYARGLTEMRRVLKPGGTLAILEFSRAQWPVFGGLFRLYLARLLPRFGAKISGVAGAYEYLHDSVSRFPCQKDLAAMLDEAGFEEVRYKNLMGGVAALHTGRKRG